jgi:hypothetical protein
MKAYSLYGHDNDSYVLPMCQGLERCHVCGELLNKWILDFTNVEIKTKMDISYAHDGFVIVSKVFKNFCENKNYRGNRFLPIKNDMYIMRPENVVEFNTEKRKTKFLDQCKKCLIFSSVIGSSPAFIKSIDKIQADSFYRTDIEFASRDEKHPLVICGESIASELRKEKFRKIDIDEARE